MRFNFYKYMDEAGDGDAGGSGGDENNNDGLLANADTGDSGEKGGEGEQQPEGKPEYIKDAFWDAEKNEVNLEALAKSQGDFEKQARTKHGEVPSSASEYKLELDEDLAKSANIPDDDPLIEKARQLAFDKGMSGEAFNHMMGGLIGELVEMGGIQEANATVDQAEEKAKLGDRADSIIEGLAKWADNLQEVGLLSEAEREALNPLAANADGVKALNKIRVHYTREAPIPVSTVVEDGQMSKEEYYSAVGSDRYGSDVDYRSKVNEQAARIFGTQPAGSSQPGLGVRQ